MFNPGNGWWSWTHPLIAQRAQEYVVYDVNIVADLTGNALVAWTQSGAEIGRIYAKRYRAGRGWLHAESIDADNPLGSVLDDLFVDSTGSVTAQWSQWNETGTVDIKTASFK
jgi:hypothetical protein